jgi:dTMP kinase
MKGRFITLEGVDGAGKSSHVEWLAEHYRARERGVVVTREPGGTALGEKLRAIVLHDAMHPDTEALMMFAARREHIEQVIRPALARGDVVVSDRFTDASFAYQCGGRGLDPARLEVLEAWVQGDLQPDLTLLFDVPESVAQARLAQARAPDRFEQERQDFHARVRSAYLERARRFPGRIKVIDGSRTLVEVRAALLALIEANP